VFAGAAMHGHTQVQRNASETMSHRLDPVPDLFELHARFPERYPALLESAAAGPNGRFDILFAFPGNRLELTADNTLLRNGEAEEGDFLDALEKELERESVDPVNRPETRELPFRGGWFVYLAYELVREIEPGLADMLPPSDSILALAIRFPAAVIHDRSDGQTWFLGDHTTPANSLDQLQSDLAAVSAEASPSVACTAIPQEDEAAQFLKGVAGIKQFIREGDVFQVNLSRLWQLKMTGPADAPSIYRNLRQSNPAPFAALARLNDRITIMSSSPERLVQVKDRQVSTRPIAGTYPRAADPEEDRNRARDLLRHPKERAEHIMLIDLERNDLGRICQPGSVRVPELMSLETYAHVHHIVSEVTGTLRPDISPVQVIRAVFPGGTITGCPKVRCMEIISELEQTSRGAYTGSLGYINRDGSMDLNILIRTLVLHNDTLSLRTGAGIVADSDPVRELAETRAKARGVLRALGVS
jgi:anthranilate synthase component 1